MHRNVFYDYHGKRYESDLVIHYGNKVIIAESKSGAITDAAKRGAKYSLKNDLTKIIQDAHDQGFILRDYIRSSDNVDFTHEKGNVVYQICSTNELASREGE